jgi:hypothetical protein
MDDTLDKNSVRGLERMRAEMVAARATFAASVRFLCVDSVETLTPEQIAAHYALGMADANATAIYVECLVAVADRARKHGWEISRPAPLE